MSIIIKVCGGLGNQLFQLANAHNLAHKFGRRLFICSTNSSKRNVYWETILCKFKDNIISPDKYNDYRRNSTVYNWASTHFEYKEIELKPDVNCYCIEGYYQSYKYFDIGLFSKMLTYSHECLTQSPDNIAVHIRRGDYLGNNFHKVISLDYYYNACKSISSQTKSLHVYIFSDDINWCKRNFTFPNSIVEYVSMKSEIDEFYMMSTFNTIIIGNSSFSWWAAYLNNSNNSKQIYYPSHWFVDGCHLNTKDLHPRDWIAVDDNLKYCKFDKSLFNVISLGSACCMVQNIHDNIYHNLGPLFRQPDNATNFFDWIITDFKFITYVFENLMFKDDSFLNIDKFTFDDINSSSQQLQGGWSNVYRKVELKNKDIGSMISLHDVKKENNEIPVEFIEKYKRRFERLYDKIKHNDTIHLMHCFDFQWLKPYFPLVCEIEQIFESCKLVNPTCKVTLYFFIHPNYRDNPVLKEYKFIDHVELCFLNDKGFHADWKANNLTFDQFLQF